MMTKPSLSELFFAHATDFLTAYLTEKLSRSSKTAESYRDALSIFRRYVNSELQISLLKFKTEDITVDLILDYRDYLQEKYAITTVNQRIAAIKTYLKYIAECDTKYLSISIRIDRIPSLKAPVRIRPVLDDDLIRQIIDEASNTRKSSRNVMIIILLYDTAMRISELTNLKMCDLFLNNEDLPYIHVRGKGGKERIIVLSERAAQHLNKYIRKYHSNNECEYLFYTCIKGNNDRISNSAVEKMLDEITARLRAQGKTSITSIHPHMFRRSRSTHLYQDGVPLEQIARILGHANLETTQIYAQMSKEKMKKIIEIEKDNLVDPEWDEDDKIAKMFSLK